ncbi:helicase-related protein [Paraburkholderia caledonica]|jgi:superfamily II DNA or RNA helicase|uniref:helicase-related protein n=1 Tax=Paraburkholderia caledonica TaxID=134536 RepID=UPI0004890E54|nr:helicase-related protein [Paraburkholderia caledonica]
MKVPFKGWSAVKAHLLEYADTLREMEVNGEAGGLWQLNRGQRASLRAIARALPDNGIIVADEVGMGKTRIAVTVARSVIECGGRVAIVVPPGLGFQWRAELQAGKVKSPLLLRSLWQLLSAWSADDPAARHPWSAERAVLISHAVANWSLGKDRVGWRWRLLPELFARWQRYKKTPNGKPHRTAGDEKGDVLVERAAEDIVERAMREPDGQIARWLDALVDGTAVPDLKFSDLKSGGAYYSGGAQRELLERAVGTGLGEFDLVIIDEAHKSRGDESGLSRLLGNVIVASKKARRMALTATPVELDAAQWKQTLGRIGAPVENIHDAIEHYSKAVSRVRQCIGNEDARKVYFEAAKRFRKTLAPYVLRRDKRQDEFVREFERLSGQPHHAYRRTREILVDPATLSSEWKQAVCAAEALSLVDAGSDASWSGQAKRLRLTVGNGHGIASLIDKATYDEVSDRRQEDDLKAQQSNEDAAKSTPLREADDKSKQRAQWWFDAATRAFLSSESALHDHPAICAAIGAIEETTALGEKVLVFGRFTRPLRSLVDLLNARAMLRCLDSNGTDLWPRRKVHDTEWPAVVAAHRQLGRPGLVEREAIDAALDRQYGKLEAERERYRTGLIQNIEKGFADDTTHRFARGMFEAFRRAINDTRTDTGSTSALALVARAMHELRAGDMEEGNASVYTSAFIELMEATNERDVERSDGQDGGDHPDLADFDFDAAWTAVEERLRDEYNRPEGGFARLMFGETRPETRRMLQLAFNRAHSFPRVLVAQSLVGREGLNLHKACRSVVLLHPEWNPGVVEQQIGRVDRLGSLWESMMRETLRDPRRDAPVPQIEVRPIVFKGTYDEVNWAVLRERWEDLRAQLHGVVIPPHMAEAAPGFEEEIKAINDGAPNFAPADEAA